MTKAFLLGLTGSIGMGKSTTAAMFADLGAAVWDADAAVHRIYAAGGSAGPVIREICPGAVTEAGEVRRDILTAWVMTSQENLARLEDVVHPLVAKDRAAFVERAQSDIIVLDVPLLFETGLNETLDAVAVVSVPVEIQRKRVLARDGMTPEKFEAILTRQMPNAEKESLADYVIDTSTLEGARQTVENIVEQIRARRNA